MACSVSAVIKSGDLHVRSQCIIAKFIAILQFLGRGRERNLALLFYRREMHANKENAILHGIFKRLPCSKRDAIISYSDLF